MSPSPAQSLSRAVLLLVGMLAAACASSRAVAPASPSAQVERYTRFETRFDVPDATLHPEDVLTRARFTAPSGHRW